MPPADIPWNIEEPPALLVELLVNGTIEPCRAVDFGCGAGNYAVYLAGKGFEMTGIDAAPTAIRLARELARRRGVSCDFIAADMLGPLKGIEGGFGFGYDWEVLHHIFPEQRERYLANVSRLLQPGALYLSVCFSEENEQFGGEGKIRTTPLGTELYFSSEEELSELFAARFTILSMDTLRLAGKKGRHHAICALMRRA